jgi:membrane peptidoglycan carboxypeptidase
LAASPARSQWWTLDELDPGLVAAVILAEDQYFRLHHGIDRSALWAAFTSNLRRRGPRVGASTIAMQLARLLLGWARPTYLRKPVEMIAAVWLVMAHGRETVLELYLNLAPFSVGTRGVAAASEDLFGHDPAQLSPFEATLLAAALTDPEIAPGSTPRFAVWLECRQQQLLVKLARADVIDAAERDVAMAQVQAAWRVSELGAAEPPPPGARSAKS